MDKKALATMVLGFCLAGVSACGSLRELAPETAASRISSSDGYKAEACRLMQTYTASLGEISWNSPGARPLPFSLADIEHTEAIFALKPQVSCRVKSGKQFFDVDSRSFLEVAKVIKTALLMQNDGTSLSSCTSCAFPDISLSNGLLLAYFRSEPFATRRKAHAQAFETACLTAGSGATGHETHKADAGSWNPAYDPHPSCSEILRRQLDAQAGRCARYGTMPYLVCPDGVWDTQARPPRPVHHLPAGYGQYLPFHGGFVLVHATGAEIYWRADEQTLLHEDTEDTAPKVLDHDANGYLDLAAGGNVFLSRADATAERKTMADYAAQHEAAAAAVASAQARENMLRLPLDKLEQLLVSSHRNDAALLAAAANKSWEWWQNAKGENRSLSEQIEMYWHAKLWNDVTGQQAVTDDRVETLLVTFEPANSAERRRALVQAREAGEANTVFQDCAALRRESAEVLRSLELAIEGSEAAQRAIGHAWEDYRSLPFPMADFRLARETATQRAAELARFLDGVCL